MARKPRSKPPLTEAERHTRFVETARGVEASEDPKDFEDAFALVAKGTREKRRPTGS